MKAYADLKNEYDSLTSDYKKSQHNLFSYKAGLQLVEERLVHYMKNEVVFTEKINVLNLEVKLRDKVLAQNLEKSKAGLEYKELIPESFVNSSELLEKHDNRSTKGYHEVPPPLIGNYTPLKRDLKLVDEHFKSEYVDVSTISSSADKTVKTVDITHKGVLSIEVPKSVMKNNFGPPIIEDWHSDDNSEDELSPTVKDVSPTRNNSKRVNHKKIANKFTHPHPKRVLVPQAVLTRSTKIHTAAASVNTVVRPVNAAGSQSTVNHSRRISKVIPKRHLQQTRPFNKLSSNKRSVFNKKVNTVRVNDSTARERSVVSGNMGSKGSPQQKEYKEKEVIDSGCSRHMTGNKCYLTDFEAFDGGFVSFGDEKGRISGKGKIKIGILDFDDVYFCKELKYNMFSVSQMCAKKNNVLFTDTECLVLSSNFKLLDESKVLLRVPRKDNIYSVDLKSVVPTGGLTCLFAKATLDESNLWHGRLGHINFKTMNKLVK
nr:ribonuclease H-like domain-containing protein [Tanacetum cinerariifolium]